MKKRIAYIGLSYPLLYDYKNKARLSENDLTDSPNPIIESPLGLLILYDELWFLCESICPDNMRTLPYVKFIDKMFGDLYYEGADVFMEDIDLKIEADSGLPFTEIVKRMNIDKRYGVDNHTHGIRIGNVVRSGNSDTYNLAFDIYVLAALREQGIDNIELIANSRFGINESVNSNRDAEAAEKILIPGIPNYLSVNGPYHPCMEELRSNKYLTDFRKWIMENHNTIQKKEISEMCSDVHRTIEETKKTAFKKYLEDNDKYSFYLSSGKTIIRTAAGIVCAPFSIADAWVGIRSEKKEMCRVNGDRWQGFVVESQDIINADRIKHLQEK